MGCSDSKPTDSAPGAVAEARSIADHNADPLPPPEYTLALIKPDAVAAGKADEIVSLIQTYGFTVVSRKELTLYKEQAEEFYAEHRGKPFFDTLVSFMTSGPLVALVLSKPGAIAGWRSMMGPTNVQKAQQEAPDSIRARYGTDGTKNASHGSDSAASAAREISFFFPELLNNERTLALIKPDAVRAGKVADILKIIQSSGFVVLGKKEIELTRHMAEVFYGEHQGKHFFGALVDFMTSGPLVAMVLSKPGAIKAWRTLMGPTNVAKARDEAPNSIRALFGTDGTQNASHGSDSPASAAREIAFFFPGLANERTLALIKPDAVHAGKADEIMKLIEADGFVIVAKKEIELNRAMAEEFYIEHQGKHFFGTLVDFMTSGPLIAMVLSKPGAIRAWRTMMGPTNAAKAREEAPSSIRALFATDGTRNAAHGSDSPTAAAREIAFFFPELR